jgi:small subunit ribosomal protein S6
MKLYELLYIIPTPFTEKEVPQIQDKVANLIKETGGQVEKTENLGNRKLAYEIKHVKRGFYISNVFIIEPTKLKTLEQKLKLMPEILRFQICRALWLERNKTSTLKKKEKKVDLKENIDQLLNEI